MEFEIVFWHWWSLGLLLLILEILASGTFFLWIAIAAGVVGLVLLIFPGFPLVGQVAVLGIISIGSILLWLKMDRNNPVHSDQPLLNQRGHQLVGRSFTLVEPIVNGYGKIRVDDSLWKVSADQDQPQGSRVHVTGIDGTVLRVDPE